MSALVFLLVFVVLSLIGGLVLWLRERSPTSMESHMRAFQKQRQALSPESWPEHARPRRRPDTAPRMKGPRPG